ncbi:fimbrin [Tritrichomonas musculus]|uniref:Fimbrin n=1 Tax=Tritrichomonas musculus TaxID=1915356 RepID=A0ABR2L768_9EUKA
MKNEYLQTHPKLTILLNKGEKIENLSPEEIRLWRINLLLKNTGSKRTATDFSNDFSDSEILTTVLTQIAPECSNKRMEESDLLNRADMMLKELSKINCLFLQSIIGPHTRLIFAFVVNLFNNYPFLTDQISTQKFNQKSQ